MTLPAQQMAVVGQGGLATVPWYTFFAGLATGGSGGAILVNPGTGNNSRPLNAALADYANVNDYLNVTDTDYFPAATRALADKNHVFFPPKPWLGTTFYNVSDSIVLGDHQSIHGVEAASVIQGTTAAKPVIKLASSIFKTSITGLYLTKNSFGATGDTHSNTTLDNLSSTSGWQVGNPIEGGSIPAGTTIAALVSSTKVTLSQPATATASGVAVTAFNVLPGGDGVQQGQGLTDWVNSGVLRDVTVINCWHGFNLGKAFYCDLVRLESSACFADGFSFTTTGNSDVGGGTNAGGPMQWYLETCNAGSNWGNGFSFNVSGTGHLGAPASMGTMKNCTTFNNTGKGVACLGSAAQPLASVRIDGGFFGQDGGDEIYLDTYGTEHFIRFDFAELAGNAAGFACGVRITANNSGITVYPGQINGCAGDGVFTAAADTMIVGGMMSNNGLGGVATRQNGINFFGVAGMVIGARCRDTGPGTQKFGIASDTDGMQLIGCDLRGNVTNPTALATLVTTQIVGCFPATLNQIFTDELHVYGATAWTPNAGVTNTSGLNVLGGGMTFSAGVVGNTINAVDNITVRNSLGVGTLANGATGRLDVSSIFGGGGNITLGNGLSTGTVNLFGSNWSITGSSGNIFAAGSIGLNGSLPSGTAGTIDADRIHAGVDLSTVSGATTHLTGGGSVAMSGGVTISSGGMNFTNTGTNSINAVDNIVVRNAVSIGSPTGALVAAGTINVATGVYLNNVAYTNP